MQNPTTQTVLLVTSSRGQQVRRCGREVSTDLSDVEADHQLLRLIRLGRLDAAVVIDGQGDEPPHRQTLHDLLDVWHQAPPLLDHDHAPGRIPDAGIAITPGLPRRRW